MTLRLLPGLIAAVSLIAAGCGSSHTTTTSFAAASTAATNSAAPWRFVSQANHVCQAANRQVEALPRETSLATFKRDVRSMLSIGVQQQSQLAALKPPTVVAASYSTLLRGSAQQMVIVRRLLTELAPQHLAALRGSLAQLHRLSDQDDNIANALGLFACAASPAPRGTG